MFPCSSNRLLYILIGWLSNNIICKSQTNVMRQYRKCSVEWHEIYEVIYEVTNIRRNSALHVSMLTWFGKQFISRWGAIHTVDTYVQSIEWLSLVGTDWTGAIFCLLYFNDLNCIVSGWQYLSNFVTLHAAYSCLLSVLGNDGPLYSQQRVKTIKM